MPVTPKFSVLISVYAKDDPTLFDASLRSIFQNTLMPEEVLLVVDGPVPLHLNQVICKYCDSHANLNVARLSENGGLAGALNYGLTLIRTEFVFRADADDINVRRRFEIQMEMFEAGYDLIGGAILEVDNYGAQLARRILPCEEQKIRKFGGHRNPFNHMTVGFRKSQVEACGGYPDIHLKEDYALWASMLASRVRTANTKEVLVHVTAGTEMYARRGGLKYALAEIELQTHLYSCGLKSASAALFDGVVRSIIFLSPGAIRGQIYKIFLRTKAQGE